MSFPTIARRLIGQVAMMVSFALAATSGAFAQTLTAPNNASANSPSAPAAKSAATKHVKACPQFGAGFVQIPGSDACIKVGGFVDGQAGGSR
jgi:hypothetical protein